MYKWMESLCTWHAVTCTLRTNILRLLLFAQILHNKIAPFGPHNSIKHLASLLVCFVRKKNVKSLSSQKRAAAKMRFAAYRNLKCRWPSQTTMSCFTAQCGPKNTILLRKWDENKAVIGTKHFRIITHSSQYNGFCMKLQLGSQLLL